MRQIAKRRLTWFLIITFVLSLFILTSGFTIANFAFAEISSQSNLPAEKTEFKFTKTLRRGSRGDDVKWLQEFLKQSPEIYPEGLITGYFGPLTEKAVKKFQTKYEIESIGIIGPKTRSKLNELFSAKSVVSEKTVKPEEKKEILLPTPTSQFQSDPPATYPDWLKKEWENNIEEIRRTQEELGMVGMHNENLPQLLQWADKNQIRVIKSGNILDVAEGSLVAMPFINEAYEGFEQIPPHLIKFLQNETVNFANRRCMTSAAVVNIGVKEEIKMKVNFLLCQSNISSFAAVHEVGHIVDECGIRNIKGNEFSFGKTNKGISAIREEYDRIFDVPAEYERAYYAGSFTAPPSGFMSVYSTKSESENFADHFASYIFDAQRFREQATKEPLLAEKYEFLKNRIFLGKEY